MDIASEENLGDMLEGVEQFLAAVSMASNQLMTEKDFDHAVNNVLNILGNCIGSRQGLRTGEPIIRWWMAPSEPVIRIAQRRA